MSTLTSRLVVLFSVSCAAYGAFLGDAMNTSPHLIGGREMAAYHRPYTARLLLSKGRQVLKYCGAARIDSSWFLTLAECLDTYKFDHIGLTIPHYTGNAQRNIAFNKATIIEHPKYDYKTKAHNVALLKCPTCSHLWAQYFPLLPAPNSDSKAYSGRPAVTAGWAKNDSIDQVAQKVVTTVEATVIDSFWCRFFYYFMYVDDYHICVFGSGVSLSEHDAGIPLVATEKDNTTTLIGIASSITPWMNFLTLPMVFIKMPLYSEWIHNVTQVETRG